MIKRGVRMALAGLKTLLTEAEKGRYALGSFSVANMEMILGVLQAAETLHAPVILQVAQVRLPYSPLEVIGPMMLAAAKAASVPVAVHLDHGVSLPVIRQALELGFTSVMFDGSRLSLEENIFETNLAGALAAEYGAGLEGEIGRVGGTEDGNEAREECSDVEEALRFYRETQVDALAVAIGNAHGVYRGAPILNQGVLCRLHEAVPVPLVLHGGSGISADGFRQCIQNGIRKINIATASFIGVEKGLEKFFAEGKTGGYFGISDCMVQAVKACAVEHIRIFGSDGKA